MRETITDTWASRWHKHMYGMHDTALYVTIHLLDDDEAWRDFFVLHYRDVSPAHKIRWLRIITKYFHDDIAVRWIREQEKSAKDVELLILQHYLIEHNESIDEAKLSANVTELRQTRDGKQKLLMYGAELLHEQVAPFLISELNGLNQETAIYSLRRLAGCNRATAKEWRSWSTSNIKGTRREWVESALVRMRTEISENPISAAKEIESGAWDDPRLASHFLGWAQCPELRRSIGRWIVKNYRPYLRDEFVGLSKVIMTSPDWKADPYTVKGFRELGLIDKHTLNWDDILKAD